MDRRRKLWTGVVVGIVVAAGAVAPAGGAGGQTGTPVLPIVFVHGQLGSAQQFETQAMRFTSNGYPQRLLYAFEYNTLDATNPLEALDDFIDRVLAETGAEQVYAIGHSRGTTVWTSYLDGTGGVPGGNAKVEKYVNIDGRSPAELPGGVPTIGIWGEWNTAGSGYNRRDDTNAQIGPDPAANFYFGAKSHTEVATSPEAFAVMYEFFTGRRPRTTAVVAEPPGLVTVAGRALLFPQNEGYAGATVEVWHVNPRTGHRIGVRPRATFALDATGNFGPVRVNGIQHYEFAVVRSTGSAHHFYFEPFTRSDRFVRLLTGRPGEGIGALLPQNPAATNLVLTRMREFRGDQADNDAITIDGTNVVLPATSPRSGVNLAMLVYDDGLDGVTDLGKGELPVFRAITFITGVDVAIPASPTAAGTVTVREQPRGGGSAAVLRVPNWPSSTETVTVQFRDAA